jgi:hypothetical protein
MTRQEVLDKLAANREKFKDFFVKSLAVFGSVARDQAGEHSDVDVLVEFEEGRPVGLFTFIRLMLFLEDLLGCKVDLATRDSLRSELRERILREAIRAA